MKTCRSCNFEGEDDLFVEGENKCRKCVSAYLKEYRKKNAIALKVKREKYCFDHKVDILQHKKDYYQDNRDNALEYAKQYNSENKEKLAEYKKGYNKNNREKVREYQRNYRRNKVATDPLFQLRVNCSRLIHHALLGTKNNLSILDYLAYTMQELKIHLESQFDDKMLWDNYGSYWHIDHIIPRSKLIYTSMTDENFKKCWALTNLRPLEAIANMKKGNR